MKNSSLKSKEMVHLKLSMSHKIGKNQNSAIALFTDEGNVPTTFTLNLDDKTNKWKKQVSNRIKSTLYSVAVKNGCVFVSGGLHPNKKDPTNEVYLYTLEKWLRLPDMRCARYKHALTCCANLLVAVGGIGCDENRITSIETFDFDKWKNDGNKTKWKTSKINLLSQNFNHFAITVNSLFTSSEKQNKQKVLSPKSKRKLGIISLEEVVTSPVRASSQRIRKAFSGTKDIS